jgi:tetratricopeptide (TPR) repeat protein
MKKQVAEGWIGRGVLAWLMFVPRASAEEAVTNEPQLVAATAQDDESWRMNRRVAELARAVERDRGSAQARLALSSLLYSRARLSESRDQMEWSRQEARECLRIDPRAHACALILARAELALCQLEAAHDHALSARESGGDEPEVTLLLAEVDWAQGRYAEATHAIRLIAEEQPSPHNLLRRARLEHDLGHYPFADHLLMRALGALEDPFERAAAEVTRSAHMREAGHLEVAETLAREALELAPGLPGALAELARTLVARRNHKDATRIYRELIGITNNPTYIGELASLQRARGLKASADTLDLEATRLFNEGLARYPEALRLPAARFFLADERDVPRAIDLLSGAGRFRSSAELEMVARAHLAAGRLADAEEAIHGALVLAPVSLELLQTAALTYRTLAELSPP